jgi:hypothetical protein
MNATITGIAMTNYSMSNTGLIASQPSLSKLLYKK